MPHPRLLTKVKAQGIDSKAYNLIKAWLSGMEQRVKIKDKKSNWHTVNSEVPQGSILGPIFFISYINYLDSRINSNNSKFAMILR